MERKITTVWSSYKKTDYDKLEKLSKEYIRFLSDAKTEREFVKETIALVEKKGFKNIHDMKELKPGDKVYSVNMDKNVFLFVMGKEPLEKGMNLLGAHIDSPRLDLKQNPLYESNELALLETHYYGGVKKYQWVAMPLAMHGVVFKEDGTRIDISIGEDENDPVIGISDLLPHLAKDQMAKNMREGVTGEDLNILIGSRPLAQEKDEEVKNAIKKNILNILETKYNIDEEDFVSAEIEVVPAGKARDYGLDRSMIIGYGHDDRVCAYASLVALLDVKAPKRTIGCILVDKEEVGSYGATGMHSRAFENTVYELLEKMGKEDDKSRRDAITNSMMLSSDVSAAFDPNYPSVNEDKNTAFFNRGLCINKYTGAGGKSGCNDANPEFIAKIRSVFNKNNVHWQTGELGKVDQGGGGTIAYIMGNMGMQVIDAGVAVQNMHAPWEVISKADLYEAFKGYKAFVEEME
ncbi:aminopeptidase [Guggenheimella bovis]